MELLVDVMTEKINKVVNTPNEEAVAMICFQGMIKFLSENSNFF